MSTSAIRAVNPEDLAALRLIIEASELFQPALLDEMIEDYFENQNSQDIWRTFDTGEPVSVGYCAPEAMTEGTWNLLLIAVHPHHQGNSIGSQMLAYIEKLLVSRGQRLLLVETSGLDDFSRTRLFYLNNAYEKEACIRDYYQTGDDKIVFRKLLKWN